jgi:hypothetical protein
MKTLIWTILCFEWEIVILITNYYRQQSKTLPSTIAINFSRVLAKQPEEYQETSVRRSVYQKMAAFWPNSAMETTTLSTIYSQYKKKREKSQDVDGWQYQEESPFGLIRVDPYAKSIPKPRKISSLVSMPSTVILEEPVEKRKSLSGGSDLVKKIKKE